MHKEQNTNEKQKPTRRRRENIVILRIFTTCVYVLVEIMYDYNSLTIVCNCPGCDLP